MRRGVSDDAFADKRSRRYKNVKDAAEYMSKAKGGEPNDFIPEMDRTTPYDPIPYRDDDLTGAGYRLIKAYQYCDLTGQLLFEVCRYEHPNIPNKKEFRQRRPGPASSGVKWVASAGFAKIPYRWKEMNDRPADMVFYVEGEKDADRLAADGLLATTLAGQQWSAEAAKAFKGRNVVVIGDNDERGREHVVEAVAKLRGFVASVRVVELPGLGRTEDVSEWLEKEEHTIDELRELVAKARPSGIRATATKLLDPTAIPVRRWVYGCDYIRQFVSLLISTGGIGKSSLVIAEALAMVSGRVLLHDTVSDELRVWYWNGEDPLDELQRRFAAAMKHFKMTSGEIGEDRLFVNSGRTTPIVIAQEDSRARTVRLNNDAVEEVIAMVRENGIDVVILDPFVSTHRVNENDNGAIDLVVKAWNRIAEVTNCAVLLVHHSRKPNGGELTVDDTRGASALLAAARSARTLNTMTTKEAGDCQIEEGRRRRYFSSYVGKANLVAAPADRQWFRIETVNLGNEGFGDDVGVVTPWSFPKVEVPAANVINIGRVLDRIKAGGPWREDLRAKKEPWVGEAVAAGLGLNLAKAADKTAVKTFLARLLTEGHLRRVVGRDRHREPHQYVEVAEPTAGVGPTPAGSEEAVG